MLTILRTGNAGVLLQLDGKKILLDGVCREVAPYSATPKELCDRLLAEKMDLLAYTHTHEDHYDPRFLLEYHNHFAGPVMGPAEIPFGSQSSVKLGQVTVTAVDSRHIGKNEPIDHISYIIQGSRCLWFMGDASPLQADRYASLPKPDILLVPYGFVIGRGWQLCRSLEPQAVVILHLPERQRDIYGLWEGVEKTVAGSDHPRVYIPEIGECITLTFPNQI